ncbi:hypothetical protein [Paracoccus pacificus]|uniref:Uncharacterized protein n=1 Tax=Paracoccus pacificus TaxID=1463598 RepID=A0ABW4R927_9RHOB
MAETGTLDADHRQLTDDLASRRYFAKVSRIMGALPTVAAEMVRDRLIGPVEVRVVGHYARAMLASLNALSMRYLVSGRIEGPLQAYPTIDIHESGFPVWQEIARLANDAPQAGEELARTPTAAAIKDDMIREIVGRLTVPTRLQYAMSQRLYTEAVAGGGLFWPQMPVVAELLSDAAAHRRRWLIHWAVYDSQLNVPVVYMLEVDDTGRRDLPKDPRRWPEVQAQLRAQSLTGLMLVTIAEGFDRDFSDLHPIVLRRLYLGPIYSREFTAQEGPIKQVLDNARAPTGEDWALAFTLEELVSERAEMQSAGLFSVVERQVFRLDPLQREGVGLGASRAIRALILPQRPYQALAELDPPGFRDIRKYVPGPNGRVAGYR